MVIPSPDNFPRIPVLTPEQLTGAPAALLTVDPTEETTLALAAAHMGRDLVLQEYWSRQFPGCGVLISSALSGGSLEQRLREAAAACPRRCWLLLEPVRMEFPLPCPTGQGTPVQSVPAGHTFFSEDLCCQYTHFLREGHGFLTLWDTEDTMQKKLRMARDAGFCGWAMLEDD